MIKSQKNNQQQNIINQEVPKDNQQPKEDETAQNIQNLPENNKHCHNIDNNLSMKSVKSNPSIKSNIKENKELNINSNKDSIKVSNKFKNENQVINNDLSLNKYNSNTYLEKTESHAEFIEQKNDKSLSLSENSKIKVDGKYQNKTYAPTSNIEQNINNDAKINNPKLIQENKNQLKIAKILKKIK